MFNFFKRKNPTQDVASMPPLYFKDGEAALQYCCDYMESPLVAGGSLPALVLDARREFGTAHAIIQLENGIQTALLRVASGDGGFTVAATTSGPTGPRLQPGQLVVWLAGQHIPDIGRKAKDERFGWAGPIVGTLKPEFVNGAWTGGERFSS